MITPRAFLIAAALAGIVGCTAQGSITPIQSPTPGPAATANPGATSTATPNAAASTSDTAPMPEMTGMTGSGTTSAATPGPAAMTQSVTIQNFAFSPANVTVMRGGTVTWTNQDSVGHSATSDTAGGFDTGVIAHGNTSPGVTFNTAGTFTYHCSVHPSMHGTVTVQ
ncbi:MAG TPA: plastocyanin/azurin family copper-binding protein [Oscillatoriaceae cyanobacterium]